MKVKPSDIGFVHSEPKPAGRLTESCQGQASFEAVLKNSTTENRKQVCTAILKQIDEQSAVLKKSLTVEGVKRYCQLVKDFMKEALNDTYRVDNQTSWDRMGNRREYVIVKQVDQSLEELMDSMAEQAKEHLDLIARLDQIRGMLVDLYC